ncbi:MAG: carboxypeptidase-like regulatory domain-containing protein [Thermodesulfobacteriota bacterium]|nr:carboxypeptidase-like regulatory domain-containing protein [Thermodesulfobacteriota bacterium]
MIDPLTTLNRLYVDTTPPGAQVRILNAAFDYHSGMELSPGSYHLEVSASGYESLTQWIKLNANAEHHITIQLKAEAGYSPRDNATLNTALPRSAGIRSAVHNDNMYVRMITSGDPQQQRKATQHILTHDIKDPSVLDIVEAELLKGYKIKCNDRQHVDAMACFCEVLGASGNSHYKETLQTMTEFSTRRKIRKSALEGLKKK